MITNITYCHIATKELAPIHNPPQYHYDILKPDIEKNGLVNPLIVHRINNINEIRFGNTRYAICKELGYESLPCVVVNHVNSIPLKGEKITQDNISSFFRKKDKLVTIKEQKIIVK